MELSQYLEIGYLKELFQKRIKKSRSKGIDKISVETFENNLDKNLEAIITKLKSENYKFSPYLELLKLKGRNKHPRIISIPTIRDKMVLLIIKEILHDIFKESVNRKLPNSYIRDIKDFLKATTSEVFFLKLDLEKFYDTLNHEILMFKLDDKKVPENIRKLIFLAITNITVPQNSKRSQYYKYNVKEGVPQGLSISNILAQIYLLEFDKVIFKRKYFYCRYVDDILLINNKSFSDFRIDNFTKELEKLKLNINKEKTEQNSLKNISFNFLSYSISSSKISVAQKNIETFLRRIAAKISWFKTCFINKERRPEYLKDDCEKLKIVFIEELNDMITGIIANNKNYGWLFYFSEINDLDLLFKIDKIISNFFTNLKSFENKRPVNLKKLIRTYYSIKSKNLNYISNYDDLDTIRKKREFLSYRGQISKKKNYTDEEIDYFFLKYQQKQIIKSEQDIGYKYTS